MSVSYSGNHPWKVQVPLPRLLFGTNTKLIRSQKQIDEALTQLRNELNGLGKLQSSQLRFIRVDLPWQFRGEIQDFIFGHLTLTHPISRKLPSIIHFETIHWGTEKGQRNIQDV